MKAAVSFRGLYTLSSFRLLMEEEFESPSKRASRNKNPVTPLQRVLHCRGDGVIKSVFEKCLASATPHRKTVVLANLRKITASALVPSVSGGAVVNDLVIECKISTRADSYPTHKVRLASKEDLDKLCAKFGDDQKGFDQSSIPLDLHRLAAYSAGGWDLAAGDGMDCIHRCHTKGCFEPTHVYFGTKDTNKSTDFCPVWVLVNGCLVNICHHNPTCLYPGERVPTTI